MVEFICMNSHTKSWLKSVNPDSVTNQFYAVVKRLVSVWEIIHSSKTNNDPFFEGSLFPALRMLLLLLWQASAAAHSRAWGCRGLSTSVFQAHNRCHWRWDPPGLLFSNEGNCRHVQVETCSSWKLQTCSSWLILIIRINLEHTFKGRHLEL